MNDKQSREDQLMDKADPISGWIPPIECASGFVRSISYNIFTQLLSVEIQTSKEKTNYYPYFNFPFELFVEGVNCESKGSWYNQWVKTYRYTQWSKDHDGSRNR